MKHIGIVSSPPNSHTRIAWAVALVLITGVLMAPIAQAAVWWNSSSSPLVVQGYGSTGRGYGNLSITSGGSGTVYTAKTYQKLANADDHQVYARLAYYSNAGVCFAPSFAQCSQSWFVHASDETTPSDSASYVLRTETNPIDGFANYHKLRARMVLAIPFRPDPGSAYSHTPGLQY